MLSSSIPVNLIRQWRYCPRVVFYMELMKIPVYRHAWIKQGIDFHELQKKLWRRRSYLRFKIESGTHHHNLSLCCNEVGLHGIVDMAIETDEMVYPVEFKLSPGSKKVGDILQLAAYSILLEKEFNKPSSTGFLAGGGKDIHVIDIDNQKKRDVLVIADSIRRMLERGLKPESSATAKQCCACEFINYCNDRL